MAKPLALGLAILFAVGCFAGASASATPAALIVQELAPQRYEKDFNVQLEYAVSQELGTEGRVLPIVWSMTDPLFRAAVEDRIVSAPRPNPKLELVRQVAVKLKADYIFWIRAVRDRQTVEAHLKVYRADKVVFEDKQSLSASKDESVDVDAIAASIARTWSLKLNSGLFKDLPTRVRRTPDMDPGTGSSVVPPEIPRTVDNKQLAIDAATLAAAGQTAELINLLREAVDAAPLDPGRRRMLIDYLRSSGFKKLAAEEAMRSAALLPESPEFHIMAARAYIESGDTARAQNELNEAVAREPDSFETRLLLGELNLRKLEWEAAIENLSKAVEKNPTPQALFARALALAFRGDVDKAKADREAAVKAGEDEQTKKVRFETAASLADTVIAAIGDGIREVIRAAAKNLENPSVPTEAQRLNARISGAVTALSFVTAPKEAATSHDRRVLALNLLAQCVAQVETAVKDKDAEMLSEATMNLGEALRQANSAKTGVEPGQ